MIVQNRQPEKVAGGRWRAVQDGWFAGDDDVDDDDDDDGSPLRKFDSTRGQRRGGGGGTISATAMVGGESEAKIIMIFTSRCLPLDRAAKHDAGGVTFFAWYKINERSKLMVCNYVIFYIVASFLARHAWNFLSSCGMKIHASEVRALCARVSSQISDWGVHEIRSRVYLEYI